MVVPARVADRGREKSFDLVMCSSIQSCKVSVRGRETTAAKFGAAGLDLRRCSASALHRKSEHLGF